jgi:hypothetical protein
MSPAFSSRRVGTWQTNFANFKAKEGKENEPQGKGNAVGYSPYVIVKDRWFWGLGEFLREET